MSRLPDGVWIGLGGNQADSEAAIRAAIAELAGWSELRGVSSLYLTAPRDYFDQPDFLNAVVHLAPWQAAPTAILERLLGLERRLGRVREGAVPKGPRLIDLDLLLVGPALVDEPGLTLPHPAMHMRRFVLDPLLELEPDLADPRDGRPWSAWREACADQTIYSRRPLGYTASPYERR